MEQGDTNSRTSESSVGLNKDVSLQGKKEASRVAENSPRFTLEDYVNAKPSNLREKFDLFLYKNGLGERPTYLQEIYSKMPRTVYVNTEPNPLMREGDNSAVLAYPRNKIRTTKYTPITFLPRNIFFQFKKVANTYFLILVILGAFQVFGVASPGLAAVPLIVIVCITAIKDGFEDYKRATSDDDLNNGPIHLLQGIHNVNVDADFVSKWRRFKKSCTRIIHSVLRFIGKLVSYSSKKKRQDLIIRTKAEEGEKLHRVSTVQSDYSYSNVRPSFASQRTRPSNHMQRTHAPSKPLPDTLLNPELQKQHALDPSARPTAFKNRRWKDINVGDIVRVRANEEIPADIVLISCSDPEGTCFVETKNLDGELNLKGKTTLSSGGSNNLKHSADLQNLKFWIECDAPNTRLYNFKGTVHYENFDENGVLQNPDEKESITIDNVLLRGCTLRNTKWVIGVVVYTGSESKIMMNSGITPQKVSKISSELNFSVVINFLVLFVLCFVSGLINGLFYDKSNTSRIYYEFKPYSPTSAGNGVLSFFVALIIYQSLVPISLYISIEIIKTLQAFFIYSDVKMYYEKLDFPCVPKSWSISDDLGQIEYVFSDKTGTLTQNIMEFRKCTINGKSYGQAYTEAMQGMDKRLGKDVVKESERWKQIIAADKEKMIGQLNDYNKNSQFRREQLTFVSSEFVEDTINADASEEQKQANTEFMTALALCHTVVTEDSKEDPGLRVFKAESPDEASLVSVARDVGIVFNNRLRKTLLLSVYGIEKEYEVLHIIPFTSARKRMSCILKTPENNIIMYCKGADNVIYSRLKPSIDDALLKKTALHLEDFAKEGLRTLCIASKNLTQSEFESWFAKYHEVNSLMDESRDAKIEELNDLIEQGFDLLGGTAIEDRLQQGVPDSISILSEAGMKLWVLTGDRIETAVNIGFSCNLLGNDMKLLVISPSEENSDDPVYVENLITKYLDQDFNIPTFNEEQVANAISKAKADHGLPELNSALIIDGAALTLVFQNSALLKRKFLLLGKQCKSVICCRVSPSQKAEVVKVVTENLEVMTLAIGDGANDVAMIQAANVGVGIAGQEGRQAVMSSDYAVGQFRHLTRLMLVHGRWSYKRLAEMVPCFFYKNVVFTFTCFWYGIYSDFDGSYLYEYTFLMFYNLAFTSLPVIFLAVLDQDVSDTVSMIVPQLYRSGVLGKEWSQYKFVWYMFDGLYQSVISFFFPYLFFYVSFQNHEGLPIDHRFWMGALVCAVSVTACNIYVLLQQHRWDWLTLLVDFLSTLVVFFWLGVWSSSAWIGEFYKAGSQLLGTLGFYCVFVIAVVICVIPRFVYDFLKRNFSPRDIDIVREKLRKGEFHDYPAGYDPTNLEDVERHRILQRLNDGDTELLHKVKHVMEETASVDEENPEEGKISRAFKSVKRKATITRSRRTTSSALWKYNQQLISKPLNLAQLRAEMISTGEYKTAGRSSLSRISTTHALPGLTQAETLISYHARSSIDFER